VTPGGVAERRGNGLQSRLHGFKSRLHLHEGRFVRDRRSTCRGIARGCDNHHVQRLWNSSYSRLAVLTSLATVVAYTIGVLTPHVDAIPAAITAAVATRATFRHAAKETAFQILGALLGAAIALVIVSFLGTGPVVIFLLVLLCFVLARQLRLASPDDSPFVAAGMAVTVILVVGTHFTTELAIERFTGVVVGALCALVASAVAAPSKDTRLIRVDLDQLKDDLAALLTAMSEGLRNAPDRDTAKAWREQAVELRNRTLGMAARWEDLAKNRRWDPRIDPDDLSLLKQDLDATTVMSSRLLSIAADLHRATGRDIAALPPAAASPLADLMAMAASNIAAEDPATSLGRTQAHEAVRMADQTAQIALIGGIVSNLNRINQATADDDDMREQPLAGAT
jgi:uncharacterized membrane protein YccC